MTDFLNNVPYIEPMPEPNPLKFIGFKQSPNFIALQGVNVPVIDPAGLTKEANFTRSSQIEEEQVTREQALAYEQILSTEESGNAAAVTLLSDYIGKDISKTSFLRANYFGQYDPLKALSKVRDSELPETPEEQEAFNKLYNELVERQMSLPPEQISQAEKDQLAKMTQKIIYKQSKKLFKQAQEAGLVPNQTVTFGNQVFVQNPYFADLWKLGLKTNLKINELFGTSPLGLIGVPEKNVEALYGTISNITEEDRSGADITRVLTEKDPFFDANEWFTKEYSGPNSSMYMLENGITSDMVKDAPNEEAARFMIARALTKSHIQKRMESYSPTSVETVENWLKSFGMGALNSPDLIPSFQLEAVTFGVGKAGTVLSKFLGPLRLSRLSPVGKGAVYALDTIIKLPAGLHPIYGQNLKLLGRMGMSGAVVGVGAGLQEVQRQRSEIAFATAAMYADPDALKEYDFGLIAMAAGHGFLLGSLGFGLLPATISSFYGATKNKLLGVNLSEYGKPVLRSATDSRFSFSGTQFGELFSSFKDSIKFGKNPVDIPVNEKLALEAATSGESISGTRLLSATQERVDRVETRSVTTAEGAENLVEIHAAKRAVNETKEAWLLRIIPNKVKLSFGEFLAEVGRKLPSVADNLNVEGDTYNSLSLKDKFLVLAETGKVIDRAIEIEKQTEGGLTTERQAMYDSWQLQRKKGMAAIRKGLTKVEWEALRKEFNQGVKLPPIPESIAKLRNSALGVAERKQAANELAAKVIETARQILANPQKASQLRAVMPKEVMAAIDSAAVEQATRGRISEATVARIKADIAGEKPKIMTRLSAMYNDAIIANRLDPIRSRKIKALMEAPNRFVDLVEGNKENATRFYNHINELLVQDMISTAERDLVLAATVHLNFDSKAFGVNFKIERLLNEDGTTNRVSVGRYSSEENSIVINSGWVGSGLSAHQQRAMTILHELGHAYFYHKAVPSVYLESLRLYNNALDPNVVSFTAIQPVTKDPLLDTNFLTRLQLQNMEETFVQTFAQILTTEADVAIKNLNALQVSTLRSVIDTVAKSLAQTVALFDSMHHYKAAANIIDTIVDLDNKLSKQVSVPELMRGYAKAMGAANVDKFNQTLKTLFAQQNKTFNNKNMLTAGEYNFIFSRSTDPSLFIAMGIMKAQGKTIIDSSGRFTKDVVDLIPIYREYKKAQLNSMKSKVAFLLGTDDYKLLEGMSQEERLTFIQEKLFDISSKELSTKSALDQVLPATYEEDLFRDMKTADYLDPTGNSLRYADGFLRTTIQPFIDYLETGEVAVPSSFKKPVTEGVNLLTLEERLALVNELENDELLAIPLIAQVRTFFNNQGLQELAELVADAYNQVYYKQLTRSGGVFNIATGRPLVLDLYYSKIQAFIEKSTQRTFGNKTDFLNILKKNGINENEIRFIGLKDYLDGLPETAKIKLEDIQNFIRPLQIQEIVLGTQRRSLAPESQWIRTNLKKIFKYQKKQDLTDYNYYSDLPDDPMESRRRDRAFSGKTIAYYGKVKQVTRRLDDSVEVIYVPDFERTFDAILNDEELEFQGYIKPYKLSSENNDVVWSIVDFAERYGTEDYENFIINQRIALEKVWDKEKIKQNIEENNLTYKAAFEEVVYTDGETVWDKFEQQELVVPGGTDQTELILTLPEDFFGDRPFRHLHWQGHKNFVAHIRFNTRRGPKGEKILYIEEIQSDLHQEGRKLGYFGEDVPKKAIKVETPRLSQTIASFTDKRGRTWKHISTIKHNLEEVNVKRALFSKHIEELKKEQIEDQLPKINNNSSYVVMEVTDPSTNKVSYVLGFFNELELAASPINIEMLKTIEPRNLVEASNKAKYENVSAAEYWSTTLKGVGQNFETREAAEQWAKNELRSLLTKFFSVLESNKLDTALINLSRPVKVPFSDTEAWANLALARVVKFAVDNDFAKIAWTSGDIQALRYGKTIDHPVTRLEITESSFGSGQFAVYAQTKASGLIAHFPSTTPVTKNELFTLDQISSELGPDIAKQVVTQLDAAQKTSPAERTVIIDIPKEKQAAGAIGSKGYHTFYDEIISKILSDMFKVKVERINFGRGETKVTNQPAINVTMEIKNAVKEKGLPFKFNTAELPKWSSKEDALNNIKHLLTLGVETEVVFAVLKKNLQGSVWDRLKMETLSEEELLNKVRRKIAKDRLIYSETQGKFIAAPKTEAEVPAPKSKAILPAPKKKKTKKTPEQRIVELADDSTVVTADNFWDILVSLYDDNPKFVELTAPVNRLLRQIKEDGKVISKKNMAEILQTSIKNMKKDSYKAGTMPVGVEGDGQGRKARQRLSLETEEGEIREGAKPFYTTAKMEEKNNSVKARFKNLLVEMMALNNLVNEQLLTSKDVALIKLFQLVEDKKGGMQLLAKQVGKDRRTITRWKAELIEKLEGIQKALDIRASDTLTEDGIRDTVLNYISQTKTAIKEAESLPLPTPTKPELPSVNKAKDAATKIAINLAVQEKQKNQNPPPVTVPQSGVAENTKARVSNELTGKQPEEVLREEKDADALNANDNSTVKEIVTFVPKRPLQTVYDSLNMAPEAKLNELKDLALRAGYDALYFKDGTVLPLRPEDVKVLGRTETETNPTGFNVTKIETRNGIPVRQRIPDPQPTQQEVPEGAPVTLAKTGDVRPVTPKEKPIETAKSEETERVERKVNEERELLRANGMDTSAFKRFLSMYWRKMKGIDTDRTSPLSGTFKLMWSKFVYINTEIFSANRTLVGDEGIAQFWTLVDKYRAEEKIKQATIPGYVHKSDNQIFKLAASEVNPEFIAPVLPNELNIKIVDNEPVFITKNNRIKRIVEQNKTEPPVPAPVPTKPLDPAAAKQEELPTKLETTQAREAEDMDGLDAKIQAALNADDQEASLPLRQTNLIGAMFGGSNRDSRNFWRKLLSWNANAVQTASGTGRTIRSMQSIVRFFARMMDDRRGQTGHMAAAGKEIPKTALQCKTEEQFAMGRISERWTQLTSVMERYDEPTRKNLYHAIMKKIYSGQVMTDADVKALGIKDGVRTPQITKLSNEAIRVAREVNNQYLELGIETGLIRALDPSGAPLAAETFLPIQFDAEYLSRLSAAEMENVVAEMVKVRTNTKLNSKFLDINTMIVMGWLDVAPTPNGRRATLFAGERDFLPGSTTNALSPETLKNLELETHNKIPGRSSKGLLEELASSGKPQEYFVIEYTDKFVVYRLPKEVADLAPIDLQKYKEAIVGNQTHYTNKWRQALNGRNLIEEEMREELDFKTKRGKYGSFNAETSTNIDRPLITVGGNKETALAVPGLRPEEVFSSPALLNITRSNLADAYFYLLNGRMFQLLFQRELDKKFGRGINMIHLLSFAYRKGLQNIKELAKAEKWTPAMENQAETELKLGLSRIREEYAINADTLPYLHNPELYGHRLSMAMVKGITAWGYGLAQMLTENPMVLAKMLVTNPIAIPKEIITGLRMFIGDYRLSKSALMRSSIADMAFNMDNFRFEFGNRFLGETARGAFSTDSTVRSRFIDSRPSIGTRDKLVKGVEMFGRLAESVGSLQAATSWGRSMARTIVERQIWKHLKNGKLLKLMEVLNRPENKDLMAQLLEASYLDEPSERKLVKEFAKKVRESGFGFSHFEAMTYLKYRINTPDKVRHLQWLLENSGTDSEGRVNMFRMADTVYQAKKNPPSNIDPAILEDVLSNYQFILNNETIKISSPEPRGLARITDTQLTSTTGRLWYAMTSWLRGYHDEVILDYATKGAIRYVVGSLVMLGLFDTFSGLMREWLAGRDGEDILAELEENPTALAIRAAKSVPLLGPANGVIEAALSTLSTAQGGTWRYYGNPMGSMGINSMVAAGGKFVRGINTMAGQVVGDEDFEAATFAAALGDVVPLNPIITRSPVAIPVRTVESLVDADRQSAMQKYIDTLQKEQYPYLSRKRQARPSVGRPSLIPYTPPQPMPLVEAKKLEEATKAREEQFANLPKVKPTEGVSSVLADLLKRPL